MRHHATPSPSGRDGGAASHQFTAPADRDHLPRDVHRAGPAVRGLVGAWGFDEPIGHVAYDASGRGQRRAIAGADADGDGRFGGALPFDGVDDLVTVPDSASLDLTTG